MTSAIDDYLDRCGERMTALAVTEVERDGAARFVSALDDAGPARAVESAPYSVLDAVDRLSDTDLGRAFAPVRRAFPWKPSARTGDSGTETVVCELREILDLGDVRAGLTLLDAHCAYPRHNHPPQELYFVISGRAWWRFGGASDEALVDSDGLLYNHPFDVHSMRCEADPLLALWVLWD